MKLAWFWLRIEAAITSERLRRNYPAEKLKVKRGEDVWRLEKKEKTKATFRKKRKKKQKRRKTSDKSCKKVERQKLRLKVLFT